jgi:hypothetical protein
MQKGVGNKFFIKHEMVCKTNYRKTGKTKKTLKSEWLDYRLPDVQTIYFQVLCFAYFQIAFLHYALKVDRKANIICRLYVVEDFSWFVSYEEKARVGWLWLQDILSVARVDKKVSFAEEGLEVRWVEVVATFYLYKFIFLLNHSSGIPRLTT